MKKQNQLIMHESRHEELEESGKQFWQIFYSKKGRLWRNVQTLGIHIYKLPFLETKFCQKCDHAERIQLKQLMIYDPIYE